MSEFELLKFYCNLKTQKICFSPKVLILPEPLLQPFAHNLSQNSPIKRLLKPTLGPMISALWSKSALGNWTVLALIKGAKLDPSNRTVFTHRNGPIFRSKTDLSDLQGRFYFR